MKDLIILLVALIFMLFISGIKIEFNPFNITWESWRMVVAWLFFILAMFFYSNELDRKSRIEALNDVEKALEKEIKESKITIKDNKY